MQYKVNTIETIFKNNTLRSGILSYLDQQDLRKLTSVSKNICMNEHTLTTDFNVEQARNLFSKLNISKRERDLFKINFLKDIKKLSMFKTEEFELVKNWNDITVNVQIPEKLKNTTNFWCFKNTKYNFYILVRRNWVDKKLSLTKVKEDQKVIALDQIIAKVNQKNKGKPKNNKSLFEKHVELQNMLKQNKQSIKQKNPFEGLFKPKTTCIMMYQGGDFSFAIYKNNKEILHKSEHKYVVRKKAGGKQSNKDKTKTIKSIGSQIRRANETVLMDKIRKHILSQKNLLSQCEKIFINAPGTNINLITESFDKAGINKQKLISMNLASQKAKYQEVKRCFEQLSSTYIFF